jgi:hypothetical protein
VEAGRWGVQAAVACAVLFAAFVAHGLVPMLSRHLSFKPVLESYTASPAPTRRSARYRVEGHGTGFYSKRSLVEIASQDRADRVPAPPQRTFCLVPADDLRRSTPPSSWPRRLLRGRRLVVALPAPVQQALGGQDDNNPLKKNVWMAPQPPVAVTDPATGQTRYDWQGQAPANWSWRIPVSYVFQDAIELVGVDYPPTVRRPGKIPLTLYFRVQARPPPGS